MHVTKTPNAAWPPRLSWEQPIAVDANGMVHEATEDWLLAEFGPPPESSAHMAAVVAAAVVAALGTAPAAGGRVGPANDAGAAQDPEADLDDVLASIGFERAS